jgi:hypothetical protein
MNLTLSSQGLQLELLGWETHAYPQFGEDPQAVINNQIGTDYDIFIGVLWARIGTPTPRHPSGTLEEFQTAYQKWQAGRGSVNLMIYFKDEPVPPSKLDPAQLAHVQSFKNELLAAFTGLFKRSTISKRKSGYTYSGWFKNGGNSRLQMLRPQSGTQDRLLGGMVLLMVLI